MATKKSMVDAQTLLDIFGKELIATMPVQTLTQDTDTFNSPVITLSADASPTTGEKIAVIRITPAAAYRNTDSLGNTANQYSSHVVQIVTERNFEGTTDNITDILTGEYLTIFGRCVQLGHKVEWYRTTNGTAPTTAGITGAPVKDFIPNIYSSRGSQTWG